MGIEALPCIESRQVDLLQEAPFFRADDFGLGVDRKEFLGEAFDVAADLAWKIVGLVIFLNQFGNLLIRFAERGHHFDLLAEEQTPAIGHDGEGKIAIPLRVGENIAVGVVAGDLHRLLGDGPLNRFDHLFIALGVLVAFFLAC